MHKSIVYILFDIRYEISAYERNYFISLLYLPNVLPFCSFQSDKDRLFKGMAHSALRKALGDSPQGLSLSSM